MLVLTRKVEESIILETSDGLIEVMIVKRRTSQDLIGIAAPPAVKVHRKEIYCGQSGDSDTQHVVGANP